MKELTLIINATIYRSSDDTRYIFSLDYNAHPDVLFIGGYGGTYEEGDEVTQKEAVIKSLKRDALNRKIGNIIYNLIDERQKQATLAQFF